MNAINERIAFSDRLKEALHRAGFAHPRATELQRAFNLHYPGEPVSVFAARKWLLGEAIPTQDKLMALADWLGVSSEWLRFGAMDGKPLGLRVAQTVPKYSRYEATLLTDVGRLTSEHQHLAREFISMLLKIQRSNRAQ